MCGIVGLLGAGAEGGAIIRQMAETLVHRGPDGTGYYDDGRFAGAMRRLAINDIHEGNQPFYNEDRTVVVFYNGEIYNSPSLRNQLNARGIHFKSRTDGEVIPYLYDEYGKKLFEYLDGMYAIALWDSRCNHLLLARDIPGEKPLYYCHLQNGTLAFGSEIKALVGIPGFDRTLDRQSLWDYPTFLWIPEPRTVYASVQAVPHGHYIIFEWISNQIEKIPAKYKGCSEHIKKIHNRFDLNLDTAGTGSLISDTRRVVTQAVHSRLLSDVPIGAFLSGGLDSSIVNALATRVLGPIDSFTVGFENTPDPYHGNTDESEDAARYAKELGNRHHRVAVTANGFRDSLDKFLEAVDQPFAVSSGLGVLAIAKAAHECGLKVLLSGDCADECFGGYSWYQYLPGDGPALTVHNNSMISFQNIGIPIEERLTHLATLSAPERAWAWHYYAHEREKLTLFNPEWSYGLASSIRHFECFDPSPVWSGKHYVAQDRDFYMPNEMLVKVDRMTMAYSVEGRVPFAAPSVLALAGRFRFEDMVRGNTLKWTLRAAFSDLLPEYLISRPKHGFNVPIDHWLKGPWRDLVEDTFAEDGALQRLGIIGRDARKTAMYMLEDPHRLNGHTIFCFVVLNRWLEGSLHGNHS